MNRRSLLALLPRALGAALLSRMGLSSSVRAQDARLTDAAVLDAIEVTESCGDLWADLGMVAPVVVSNTSDTLTLDRAIGGSVTVTWTGAGWATNRWAGMPLPYVDFAGGGDA